MLAALLMAAAAIWFSFKKNFRTAIIFLILAAITLRLLMILIDPMIWLWDEQFHALVAKNMAAHPLKPTLYNIPLLKYNYQQWDLNHVWLHKQPLFMWQMAVSMKIVGYTEWAMRLPSAIMSVLLVPVIYRMGTLLLNSETGFIAALLVTFSYVLNELTTGSMAGDHNDMAFVFYITLSIWTWLEYVYSEKRKWMYLTGLFSGMAILVKWLPGLLVFSGWFVSIFFNRRALLLQKIMPLVKAGIITVLVFVPWMMYAYLHYPQELSWELKGFHSHFNTAVDGHGGDAFYHFRILPFLYTPVGAWLLLPAIVLMVMAITNKQARYGVLTLIAVVYVFYSLTATKMEFFCLPVAPLLIIALAYFIYQLFAYTLDLFSRIWLHVIKGVLLLGVAIYFLQLPQLNVRHTALNEFRTERIQLTQKYKKIIAEVKHKKYVFVNCPFYDAHILMFYSGMPAYGKMINEDEMNTIKKQGYALLVFNTGNLPAYITNDQSVVLLN